MKYSNFKFSGLINGMTNYKSENFNKVELIQFIDEVKHISSSIETLSQVNRLILQHSDENRLIHEICNAICQNENYDFASLAYFNDLTSIPFLAASSDINSTFHQTVLTIISDDKILNLIKNNKTIIISSDNYPAKESQIVLTDKYLANSTVLVFPLKDNLSNSMGMLIIKGSRKNGFNENEIRVLEDLAQDLSMAIHRIRLKEEQTQVQKELALSEKKYRLLAESSLDIISVIDSKGKVLYVSPAIETILGYKPEEIINTFVYDLIHPMDVKKVRKVFQFTITKNAKGKVTNRARTKDGKYIWMESSGRSFYENGDVFLQITIRDISDRVHFEHKLIERKNRLQLALAATKTGLWDWFIPDNKIFFSDNYFEILGYRSEEIKDPDNFWYNTIHPEDLPQIISTLLSLKENYINEFEIEYRKFKKDGEIIWVQSKGAVVDRNNSGNPIRLTGTITDISRRKSAEELLRQSEEKYRLIVENSHDGIEISQDEKFVYWNKQFANMLGYSYEELENITFKDIYTPEGLSDLYKRHEKRIRCEVVPKNYQTTLRRKDGSIINVEVNYEICDFNGKPATFATIKDITQQKKTEALVKSSEQFLQKSLDSLSSNIAVLDETGNIIAVNKRWKEFGNQNGLKEKDFCVGINYISICENAVGENSEDAKFVASEIKRLLMGEKTEFHFEYPCHSKNEKRWFVAHFTSFEHDKKPKVIVAHENITERKIAEQKIIEAKEKAEEANRLKSTFLLNMSHELRTPLVGILGFAEILSSELENEEHKKMVETIYESGNRLLETLSLILNLSKVEAGRQEIEISEFNVNSLCYEVADLFTASAKKKNLTIKLDLRFKELFIKSDIRLVRDVINNLVNNAIKFTKEGTITISSFISNYKNQNYIAIEVSDTGIGIPEDKIDLIFEEFRQVSEGMNRSFEGTGLGLALVKKILPLLGGEITVQSKLGVGTKFTVFLPSEIRLYQMNINQKLLPPPEKLKTDSSADLGTKRLLVVEDDWVSRKFIEVVLKDICSFDFAINAVEALEKVKNTKYDAILMDINLGRGMDGLSVTQMIKEMDNYKSIPIAAITAFAAQQDREEFLEKGCTHYLSKPFGKTALINLIKEMLKIG